MVYSISYIKMIKVDSDLTSCFAIHCLEHISTSVKKQLSNVYMTYNEHLLSYNNSKNN